MKWGKRGAFTDGFEMLLVLMVSGMVYNQKLNRHEHVGLRENSPLCVHAMSEKRQNDHTLYVTGCGSCTTSIGGSADYAQSINFGHNQQMSRS